MRLSPWRAEPRLPCRQQNALRLGWRYGNVRGMKKHPLTAFRDAHGLTKTALGERLGVDKSTVSRWESGKRFPPRELWPRIQKVTGLSGGDLADAITKNGSASAAA